MDTQCSKGIARGKWREPVGRPEFPPRGNSRSGLRVAGSGVSPGCVWHWELSRRSPPPREPGFQNAIEGFNGLWQSKVWQRHRCPDVEALAAVSARYIAAYRAKTATRLETAPRRRSFPKDFKLNSAPHSREPSSSRVAAMITAAFICSVEPSMSINIGLIGSFAAKLASRISASASTHYADVTPLANPCYVSLHTLALKTIPRQTMSVQTRLKLCHINVKKVSN